MLFQSGWLPTEILRKELQPSVSAWKEGKTLEAFRLSDLVRKKSFQNGKANELQAADFLWLSEIAGLSGLHSRSKALHYIAHKLFPQDTFISLMYAWDCSAFGHFYQCSEILDQVKTSGTSPEHVLKLAIKVYNYSTVNWKESAERLASKIRELVGEKALTWYVLSRASVKRTEWQRSIK